MRWKPSYLAGVGQKPGPYVPLRDIKEETYEVQCDRSAVKKKILRDALELIIELDNVGEDMVFAKKIASIALEEERKI